MRDSKSDDLCNMIEPNEFDLYFDKKHINEETPYEIEEDKQSHCKVLEQYYDMICGIKSLDEAMIASRKEREKLGLIDDDNFVYGEITFRTFSYIFEVIKKEFGEDSITKGNFIDLGSGSGKGCIAAGFLHPFNRCTGYEILDKLHLLAEKNRIKYDIKFNKFFKRDEYKYLNLFPLHKKKPELSFYKTNFLEENWSNADFVFCNATCYEPKIWDDIVYDAQRMKKGSFFVNTTKTFPKNVIRNWITLPPFYRLMSWGVTQVFIHKKRF